MKLFLLVLLVLSLYSCDELTSEEEVSSRIEEAVASSSCRVEEVEGGAQIVCPDGSSSFVSNGKSGADGTNGQNGENGSDGENGSSCSVESLPMGALISCEDETSVLVEHGSDAPVFIVEFVDPCGSESSFDEVLMKLGDERVLAHFASESKQFFTFLSPGSYKTTDGTNCYFKIDEDMEISW